jgi:hypothetical protein
MADIDLALDQPITGERAYPISSVNRFRFISIVHSRPDSYSRWRQNSVAVTIAEPGIVYGHVAGECVDDR